MHLALILLLIGPAYAWPTKGFDARRTGQSSFIADRLHAYAALDPATVRAVGADSFPPSVLGIVK